MEEIFNLLNEMDKEIIIALSTSFVSIVLAIIAYLKDVKIKKLETEKSKPPEKVNDEPKEAIELPNKEPPQIEHNIDINRAIAMDVVFDFNIFNKLVRAVNDIFQNTPIDRFLIIYGVNGAKKIDSVSVFFQMFAQDKEINAIERYSEIAIDEHYQNMLIQIENNGMILYDVSEMDESLLKDYYISEGVRFSVVKFITRKTITQEPRKDIVLFCSFATHDDRPLNRSHLSFIKAKFSIVKNAIEELTLRD